jgi:hypothetical protein
MKPPLISNETSYDGRAVNGIVRYVFKYLDLNGTGVMVKVKHHTGDYAYSGTYYHNLQPGYVYDPAWDQYREVGPRVPPEVRKLIVCRIGKPGTYPTSVHVYDRRDGPEPWDVEDWREALVCITAHEAQHLRQSRNGGKRRGRYGRYNETDTEWAALRLLQAWRKR